MGHKCHTALLLMRLQAYSLYLFIVSDLQGKCQSDERSSPQRVIFLVVSRPEPSTKS